jgi:hypothetical protein
MTKYENIQIITGKSTIRHAAIIKAAARYLNGNAPASALAQEDKHYKTKEAERLKKFIAEKKLWLTKADVSEFIDEGAEQRVYRLDEYQVLKTNDAIFYASWEDYFYSLWLHNYFFPDTAYQLTGFTEKKNKLFAVVKQPYVKATEKTDLKFVKQFMARFGFENTRNNDYKNARFEIILEDLHDENVLTKDGVLYFVDTVFYLLKKQK